MKSSFIFQKHWSHVKDTGFDVSTNNVARHIKINADEFTLEKKNKRYYVSVGFYKERSKEVMHVICLFNVSCLFLQI